MIIATVKNALIQLTLII